MAARTLYWIGGSPYAWAVSLGLEHKGLDYADKLLSASEGQLKTDEFRALNPRGKVPVLVDGDTTIYESQAILLHLELTYPEKPLLPANTADRAKALARMNEITYLSGIMTPVRPMFRGEEVDLEKAKEDFATEFGRWETYAKENNAGETGFLIGDSFTAADAVLVPFLALYARLGYPLGRHTTLAAYFAKNEALPGYKRLYPQHWVGSDKKDFLAGF